MYSDGGYQAGFAADGLPDPVREAEFYAGVPGRRLAAFLIDLLATLVLGWVAAVIFGVMTFGLGFFIAFAVVWVAAFAYRWFALARWSATPGMILAGIEMRARSGRRFDSADAFLHTALFSFVCLTGLLLVANAAAMAFGPYGRGLHDFVLGSAAIKTPG